MNREYFQKNLYVFDFTVYRPPSRATPLYSLYGYMYVPQGRVYMVFDLSVLNRVYNFV